MERDKSGLGRHGRGGVCVCVCLLAQHWALCFKSSLEGWFMPLVPAVLGPCLGVERRVSSSLKVLTNYRSS